MIRTSREDRYCWLEDALGQELPAAIVTVSRRLARDIRLSWDERQLAAGRLSWPTPLVAYWPDWLSYLIASAPPAAAPQRLGSVASSILWERCLLRRLEDEVINFDGVLRQAERTWRRVADWQVPLAEILTAAQSDDEQLFASAANDYRQALLDGGWLDMAGVAAYAKRVIESGEVRLPGDIVFTGFDRLNPALAAIAQACAAAGCNVREQSSGRRSMSAGLTDFELERDELIAAGHWARQLLHDDPDARVGIVCAGLESNAENIVRLVRDGVTPGWQYGGDACRNVVNSSYGRKFSGYPVIAIALLLLRWCTQGLRTRDVSVLLRSHFVAGGVTAGRSELELALRKVPDRNWTPADFLQVVPAADSPPDVQPFRIAVQALASFTEQGDIAMTPAECISRVDALLALCGWPGIVSPSSEEFQLLNRWRELLNEIAAIDVVSGALRIPRVIQRIARLAADTIWQPELERGRVQVLGILEAAGLEFDGLWITGMESTQWPIPSRPLPFLPIALQRRYEMPDATPADTLAFSRHVLRQLVNGTGTCILSWPRSRGDSELTKSTLLDEFDLDELTFGRDPEHFIEHIRRAGAPIEELADNAPAITADEQVRGGAYTLQRQFVEPFSAFVTGRLGVRFPEEITFGLSASKRGSLIHDALHNLLAGKPTRTELAAWSQVQLTERIGSAVDRALALGPAYDDVVIRRMLLLERDRLSRLLREFIGNEIGREEFSVLEVEHKLEFVKASLRLQLRIDRIDRVGDELLVIDYKTGREKSFINRQGELTDLQLLVYAEALGMPAGGFAFINIDTRKISYKGAGNAPRSRFADTWPETYAAWRSILDATLQEFISGDVRVNWRQSTSEARSLNMLSRFQEQKRVD